MMPDATSDLICPNDTRSDHVHEQEVELGLGDVVRIGDHLLTVIDIEGDDVSFRIDQITDCDLPLESAISAGWPPR